MAYTTLEEIDKIHAELHQTFLATSIPSLVSTPIESTSPYPLLSIPYRVHQLKQLARLARDNADAFCDTLYHDLGKPRREVLMTEIAPVVERTLECARKVEEWAGTRDLGDELPEWQSRWGARVEKRAKGVGLIISPWNYPLVLTCQPLYGAIAAGCCAVLKPSEMVPRFSALLSELVPKYLDPAAYRVVIGAVPEITRLLELKWDHIMYTGNGRVARIIATAAAKHLTPMTLELGGKSPVIVDPATCGDLDVVAKRIIWGKINNSGPICVAPDYVVIPSGSIPAFTEAISKVLSTFFPDGALASTDYARIVTDAHFRRIKSLLERTKGKVVIGGKTGKGGEDAQDRGIEPTIVTFESAEEAARDALMEEELFAPVLPIIGVKNTAEALAFIRQRDHPLVIYAFTDDEGLKRTISNSTISGNVVFNDTLQQLGVDSIPFGGIGESGYGRQTLKYSFEEFVYDRSLVDIPLDIEPFFALRYPPTTEQSLGFFSQILQLPID